MPKFVLFVQERELMVLKYWHLTITKDVKTTKQIDKQTVTIISRAPERLMVSKL